ncbi:uncharacterized protein ACA1_310370, partial [Acanthamoeba castellanii str. Neff]
MEEEQKRPQGKEGGSATVAEDAVRKVVVKRQCSQLEVELLQLQHQREKEDNVLAVAQAKKKKLRADLDAFVADTTRMQHV